MHEPLKPREIEILRLMSVGMTNREISERLFIGIETVKWYARQIYGKLHVKNRSEASHRASELGLFDSPDNDTVFPQDEVKHNLPATLTPFVGRERELNTLSRLVEQDGARLITIQGAGGMGKTRLALELAQWSVGANLYPDGVYFVELAPISEAVNIPNAIADAAGYQFLGEETAKEQLLSIIRERKLLFVLDNFEHLPDGFTLVTDMLKSAPQVDIVATSRQRLGQSGETLFHLSGMDFPDWQTPAEAMEYAAVKLFMNSAKRVRPDFELVGDTLNHVAQVCKLVQGMPLGIELAASWMSVLSISEIADEIQQGLDFLVTDYTDLPERQRSMNAVMDHSWQMMSASEKKVFMKLSVFRGGFTREAAQAVAGANLRILMSLVNKSMIRHDNKTGRYQIHELLRQYAEEHLSAANQYRVTRSAHCSYFISWLQSLEPDLHGYNQYEAGKKVQSDFDNVDYAWHFAVDEADYERLSHGFYTLFCLRYAGVHRHRVTQLVQFAGDHLSQLEHSSPPAIWGLIVMASNFWDRFSSIDPILDGFKIVSAYGNPLQVALGHFLLAVSLSSNGQVEDAIPSFKSAIEFGLAHDRYLAGIAMWNLAVNYAHLGKFERTRQTANELLALTAQTGDRVNEAWATGPLIYASGVTGDFEQLDQVATRNIEARQQIGNLQGASVVVLAKLIYVEFTAGNLDKVRKSLEGEFYKEMQLYRQNRGFCIVLQSLILTIDGIYYDAAQLIDNMRETMPDMMRFVYGPAMCVLLVAKQRLGDKDGYQSTFVEAASYATRINGIGWLGWLVAPVILYHFDNRLYERTAELFGLAFAHPNIPSDWLDHWDVAIECRAQLEQKLGVSGYQAALNQGKLLDLETVIQELIDVFRGEV